MMAEEPKEKVEYTKSTAQLDAEARAEQETPETVAYRVGVNPEYGKPEDGGYVGVSPEYRNAADVRQEPLTSDEDWQNSLLPNTEEESDSSERASADAPSVSSQTADDKSGDAAKQSGPAKVTPSRVTK